MPTIYTTIENFGAYALVRHQNGIFYIAWYDSDVRQTRRRSLKTKVNSDATDRVRQISELGDGGRPQCCTGNKARPDRGRCPR